VRDADLLIWVTAENIVSDVGPGRTPDITVRNKCDLEATDSSRLRNDGETRISVKTGFGLKELRNQLHDLIQHRASISDAAVVVRDRHIVAVRETIRLLNDSLNGETRPLELIAEDLRKATRSLTSITGRIDVEDLLGKIFSEFCIGK
jgi:tRNA modification GTPase